MRNAMSAFALAILESAPGYAQDRIGESCSGTETVQIGVNAPKVVPYALSLSADLAAGYVCYAESKPEQTFAIKDRGFHPIKLADVSGGNLTRLTTFDRRTGILKDHQIIQLLGSITRNAKATCRAAAFHQPTPLRGN